MFALTFVLALTSALASLLFVGVLSNTKNANYFLFLLETP